MTKRREFSRKVRAAVIERAAGKCEKCQAAIKGTAFQIDHILPAELGGEPVIANAMLMCLPCHKEKTGKQDVPRIRKSDRQRDKASGAVKPKGKIQSRGFDKQERKAKPALPPRQLYRSAP